MYHEQYLCLVQGSTFEITFRIATSWYIMIHYGSPHTLHPCFKQPCKGTCCFIYKQRTSKKSGLTIIINTIERSKKHLKTVSVVTSNAITSLNCIYAILDWLLAQNTPKLIAFVGFHHKKRAIFNPALSWKYSKTFILWWLILFFRTFDK